MKQLHFKRIITFLLEDVKDKTHIIFQSKLFRSYFEPFKSYIANHSTCKTYFEKRLMLLNNNNNNVDNLNNFFNSFFVLPHQNQSVEATFKSGKRAAKARGANTSERTMNNVFIATNDGINTISNVRKLPGNSKSKKSSRQNIKNILQETSMYSDKEWKLARKNINATKKIRKTLLNPKLSEENNNNIISETNQLKDRATKRDGKAGNKKGHGRCVTLETFDCHTTIPSDYVANYPDMIAINSICNGTPKTKQSSIVTIHHLVKQNLDDGYNGLISKENIFTHFPLQKRNMTNPYKYVFKSVTRKKWDIEIRRVLNVIKNNEGTKLFYKRIANHDIYLNQDEFDLDILETILINNDINLKGKKQNKRMLIEKIKTVFIK